MINGFDEQTKPLTPEEKKLLPMFIGGLMTKLGAENAITADSMAKAIYEAKKIKVGGPRVRKIINHIRMHGLVPRLIATSDGYYIATDNAELRKYIESLKQREGAIRVMREALEKQ